MDLKYYNLKLVFTKIKEQIDSGKLHLCFLRYFHFLVSFSDKRNKFDNGEDPLDPESQQGQGFNPFGQGFNPFGGGGGGGQGFNFKFHF